ncbi:hypothetical protein DFR70_10719 [Nocardia tenerifensis]|uniref:DUF732 domain-containing protein n=1 Tax=Nocardia tenerifensis TaxID=228006 RepID=A0A318K2B2_9NOCA|nr:hypothetical protein [Nocardia tenerifensis]PXX62152.1 hypothetical protein DFR70_10719 [Nocardia tenerifensis]
MIRTTAALAASATLCALLLTGCGDDKASSAAPSSASATQSSGDAQVVDNVKAGAFVVSFRGAFPKLADGKDDAKIATILSDTCKEIKANKSEDDIVKSIVKRSSGKTEATPEEARAVYQMAKMMC